MLPSRVVANFDSENRYSWQDVGRVVFRCLAKRPDGRYQCTEDLLRDLRECHARVAARDTGLLALLRRPFVLALGTVVLLGLISSSAWLWVRQARINWVRTEALPEAARLVSRGRNLASLRLLRQAEHYVPDDPLLRELLRESTNLVNVTTSPPGAEMFVRDFFDAPDTWEPLGQAPIEATRVPAGLVVWKVSAPGFETIEQLRHTNLVPISFVLRPLSEVPDGMVEVPLPPLGGTSRELRPFWIDKYEVTNRQFQEFVRRGGYDTPGYWADALAESAGPMSFDDLRRRFRDRTGRSGPSTWELGEYPDGQADYPVGGVSWFEAVAYCAALGKRLPTVHHWNTAALFAATTEVISYSRFSTTAAAPVGQPLALGYYGAYDMGGNVKEWTWNGTGRDERRYLLGGSWAEPSYMFNYSDAQHSLERHATYGFRCAQYDGSPAQALLEPVEALVRDFRREKPSNDQTFSVLTSLFRYDHLPLDARLESTEDSLDYARIEQVSFTAAYGDERVPALLFLPRDAAPPLHAVIYMPGSNVLNEPGPFGLVEREQRWFLFLVRSGRAVVVPIYKGSFERKMRGTDSPLGFRDFLVYASKDAGRTLDYLATRPDIDPHRLAFYGISSGAVAGPIMTAVERRFLASILLGGGLPSLSMWSETHVLSFLPRVHVPTLMINGRHDFFFPLETSQRPMFEWLGTADKRHRVFDSGHVPSEWQDVMREVLDWLDQHLGVVSRRPVK